MTEKGRYFQFIILEKKFLIRLRQYYHESIISVRISLIAFYHVIDFCLDKKTIRVRNTDDAVPRQTTSRVTTQ